MNQQRATLGSGKNSRLPRALALAAGLLCALASAAPARAGDDLALSTRKYSDKLSGFWLRPPEGCEQMKEPSSSGLVRWNCRDANTRAILWSLGVNVVTEAKADPNLREYSLGLVQHLRTHEGLDSNSPEFRVELRQVDNKGAIDVRGSIVGLKTFWRRQVWVLAEPGRFLIFWVSGSLDQKERLDKLLDAVLGTVKTFDPLEILKAEEAHLLRGRLLLEALRARKIALAEAPQWYVFRQDGNILGWTLQTEGAAQRQKKDGIEIKTLTMLRLPKDQLRLLKRTMFAGADGSEQWQETLAVGEGAAQAIVDETGLRQEGMVLCTVTQGVHQQSRKKPVPADANEPRDLYLTHAYSTILPRLLDLTKPGGYAFAVYASQDNRFKLRTMTVVGPDKIVVNGRQVDAIRLTDMEEANDEIASTWWVDAKGMTLRIKGPGWPDIEASTRDEITDRMPEARKVIVEALGK